MKRFLAIACTLLACAVPAGQPRAQGLVDSDGDRLPDVWETQGVTLPDSTGQMVFVNLPAMGASAMHKDIFVEVDYMQDGTHTHNPKAEALDRVIAAFAQAPNQNPDGTTGINIHIDAGRDTIMIARFDQQGKVDRAGSTKWGDLSQASVLAEQPAILGADFDQTGSFAGLQAIKSANFNAARSQIFRYCVFGHMLTPTSGSSGIATGIGSLDFVVTLGGFEGGVGTTMDQAGTFMHELGHSMGLRHGGNDDVHRKPNFLSVMNYLFQTRGLRVNGMDYLLDFSRSKLSDLDENALNESVGIAPPSAYGTRWENDDGTKFSQSNTTSPIDWNDNRTTADPPYAGDVNFDMGLTVLAGHEEWTNLQFAPIGPGGGSALVAFDPAAFDEITHAEDDQIPSDFDVWIDLEDDLQLVPAGEVATYVVTVSNEGTLPDTYRVTTDSSLGWADFSGLPSEVTLDPRQERTFMFTVSVPANAAVGETDESVVEVESIASPLLGDEVEALTEADAAEATTSTSSGGGCSTGTPAGGSLAPFLLLVGLLALRRRTSGRSAPPRAR